ncbi:MAG: adenylate/guanylate cyclase domain-containing protein [Pseudomonadota bacterium]
MLSWTGRTASATVKLGLALEQLDMERRLSAILALDVAGYSTLMSADETGAFARVRAAEGEVWAPAIAAVGGRIVKRTGDGLLAEFPSATSAVEAAAAIQKAMVARGPDALKVRIGVELGDVILDGGDVYGNGVNRAVRLESVAETGGISLSEQVHSQIQDRSPLNFEQVDGVHLKGAARPVRIWKWRPETHPSPQGTAQAQALRPAGGDDRPLEVRASLAVLPFQAFGAGPDAEALADGVAEDIITTLTKAPDLLVAARNSSFVFKGRAVDVREAAGALGVRHVLEGSVRSAAGRVRVTAQLIDAETGGHVWAERFDGPANDVFALIDDIALRVMEGLEIHLSSGEQVRLWRRGSWTVPAYVALREGRAMYFKFTRRTNEAARERLLEAVRLSPDWAVPHAYLGWTYADEARYGWGDRAAALERADAAFADALSREPDMPFALGGLGYARMIARQHDEALDLVARAAALAPSSGDVHHPAAMVSTYSGRPDHGLDYARYAMRLSPIPLSNVLTELGHAYIRVGEPERGLSPLSHALEISPWFASARLFRAEALDALGRGEDAQAEVAALLSRAPRFRLSRWLRCQPFRDQAVLDQHGAALARAGLPD